MDNRCFKADTSKTEHREIHDGIDSIERETKATTATDVIVDLDKTGVSTDLFVDEYVKRHGKQSKGDENIKLVSYGNNGRTITSQKDLEDRFHFGTRPSQNLKQFTSKQLSKCSTACLKRCVCSVFPFVNIMKNYNIKEDIPRDIVAGLTVGIMHIPHSMAYALLATLPPVYGLYTSFFPVLVYFFLGSSKHISLGTGSVPYLMIGTAVSKGIESISRPESVPALSEDRSWNLTENHIENYIETTKATADDISEMSEDDLDIRVQFAMSVTFMVGAIQLLMSIFRLGFITDYMSDALVSGFTTGVACHVFTSQVKYVFSVKLTSYSGPFKIVYIYRDLFRNIGTSNYVTVLLSVFSMVVLYITARFINENPKLRPKMFMPVPIELIIIVIGTVITYVLNLAQNHDVDIVSDIPTGLPIPNTKGLSRISWTLLIDVVPIVIVIFSTSISIASILAKIHDYDVDPNQELFAFGVSSIMCSFMSSLTPMAALSRAVVQERVGGRTQVAGLVSCCLLLVVLLAIGPYFKTTPKCVLASVIMVTLRAMFLHIFDLKKMYRVSKTDFFVWIVAFVATVLLDVDLGLGVAVAFNILTVICKVQRPYFRLMGLLPDTNLYRDVRFYQEAKEIPGIKIVRYEQSLFFLNKEHFRSCLIKNTVNPAKLANAQETGERKLKQMREKEEISAQNKRGKEQELTRPVEGQESSRADVDIHTIILDCSPWSFIDSVGVKVLSAIISDYKAVGIKVFLANCTGGVLNVFEKTNFYNTMDRSDIYMTLQDAVLKALYLQSSSDSVQIDNAETFGIEEREN